MERRKEEKNLWINSNNQELFYNLNGTTTYTASTNNFYYNIGTILYEDNYKKLSVELVDCAISKSYHTFNIGTTTANTYAPIPFYTTIIKVYINFNVSSNSVYNNSNGLLMGLIPTNNINVRLGTTEALNNYYYSGLGSSKLESENKIKYYLKNIPSGIININIYNELNNVLLDYENNPPANVLLCLKFKYEF